jgi:hypothetical protein
MRGWALALVLAACDGTIGDPPGSQPVPGVDPDPIILPDAPPGEDPEDPRDPGDPGVTAIVGVGYGGIRIISRDLGTTWTDETHFTVNGGDDNELLRSIVFGNKVWIAAGARYLTSPDGVSWTDRGRTRDVIDAVPCVIAESIAFTGDRFVAACGDFLASSTDGLAWTRLAETPAIEKHPELSFDPATRRLAITGDNLRSFVSSDLGATWTELANVAGVRFCKDAFLPEEDCPGFWVDGVFLESQFPSTIRRAVGDGAFREVYVDPSRNEIFTSYAFAVGRVAR